MNPQLSACFTSDFFRAGWLGHSLRRDTNGRSALSRVCTGSSCRFPRPWIGRLWDQGGHLGCGPGPGRRRRRVAGAPARLDLGRTQALRGNIDAQFVRPLLVGETVLLFRLRAPQLAVIIYDGTRLVEGNPALDAYPGLASRASARYSNLIAQGHSNRQIARRPTIGEQTVKTHVTATLTKLNLQDRIQAAIFAFRHQVVSSPDQQSGPTVP